MLRALAAHSAPRVDCCSTSCLLRVRVLLVFPGCVARCASHYLSVFVSYFERKVSAFTKCSRRSLRCVRCAACGASASVAVACYPIRDGFCVFLIDWRARNCIANFFAPNIFLTISLSSGIVVLPQPCRRDRASLCVERFQSSATDAPYLVCRHRCVHEGLYYTHAIS